ncbi:MAG: hypothetical protein R2823_10720 [Acidimicrobiia bacterium]
MRKLAIVSALVLALMAIAGPAAAKADKTWVCHHTHSETNPIILVHVSNGWDKGHGNQKVSKHQTDDQEVDGYDGKAGPAAKRGFSEDCQVQQPT